MTTGSLTLLLGIVGVAAVVILLPLALVRARRAAALTGRVPRGPLLLAVALGVLLVASITAIVGTVVLG